MSKIEKLKYDWVRTDDDNPLVGYSETPRGVETVDKINELIEAYNQDHEQKELPEPVMRETIKLNWGDTELVFHEDSKNLLESIVKPEKQEDWREEFKPLLYKWGTNGRLNPLYDFISQLLSERTFSKEELFMLKLAMNDIHNTGNKAYEGISNKLSKLLNEEK